MAWLDVGAREDQLRRMMREARLAARLNHRSAVSVYDLVMVDGQPNVVMEYVEGQTLSDEIRAGGTLAPERVADVGAAIADALAEAHELGIVHRDIKPANILVTRRGRPKLADFGIAKITGDAGITSTGIMIGTPAFVAPEVARGKVADAASDIWSLGATLYSALEGHSPFQRDSVEDLVVVLGRLVTQPVPPLSRPGPVGDVVMSMLAGDPAARPRRRGGGPAAAHAGRHRRRDRHGARPAGGTPDHAGAGDAALRRTGRGDARDTRDALRRPRPRSRGPTGGRRRPSCGTCSTRRPPLPPRRGGRPAPS